jgi:hypothetical protein
MPQSNHDDVADLRVSAAQVRSRCARAAPGSSEKNAQQTPGFSLCP